jgi:thiol-disulfide isomerase/thioredoxin
MKMRVTFCILAVILLPLLAAAQDGTGAPAASTGYAIGSTVAGDIQLKDIYGKEHSLKDYRGKVVFIHFWSIVCPYEKLAEPKCKDLQKEFADKGVVEIAINANQRELKADSDPPYADLREHVEKAGVNFIVTVDPGNKVTDMFDGKSTPHCFVIDRQGVLRYSGALDDDPKGEKGASATNYVRDAIQAVLAGQPVAVATTKPYG